MAQDLAQRYTTEIREQLSYLGAWQPGERIRIGDIGVMEGHRFISQAPASALSDLSLGSSQTAPIADISYSSAGVVEVSTRLDGKVVDPSAVVGKVGAELVVSFGRAHAVLLELSGLKRRRIADQIAVQHQLLDAWDNGTWQPEWCLVTEIIEAESTSALMSISAGANVHVEASAEIAPGQALSLAAVGAGIRHVRSKGIGLKVFGKKAATPLLKGIRLRNRFVSWKPKVVIEGMEPPEDDPFVAGELEGESVFESLGDE